jgi:hypothetical protein
MTAIAAIVTLLLVASDPWYQHLPWPLRAAVVLGTVAPVVIAAMIPGRTSRKGQED